MQACIIIARLQFNITGKQCFPVIINSKRAMITQVNKLTYCDGTKKMTLTP